MNESPGRAWDEKGVFVSVGVGQAMMFDFIHTLERGGRRMGIVANKAESHYMTAFRADSYIDEISAVAALVDAPGVEACQYLVGRKPRRIYQIHFYNDKLGEQIDWRAMTPEQIREFYRLYYKSIVLIGLKCNLLYIADLAVGSRSIIEALPAQLTLSRAGWQPIPAARLDSPHLWLSRYGEGVGAYLVVGNPATENAEGTLVADNRYLGAGRSLFVLYDGRTISNVVRKGETLLPYSLAAKEYAIFKTVLTLEGAGDLGACVTETASADKSVVRALVSGLTVAIQARARVPEDMEAAHVRVNDRDVPFVATPGGVVFSVTPGQPTTAIEVVCQSRFVLTPEKGILDFPVFDSEHRPLCSILLSDRATDGDREVAWWIQDYFRVYAREVLGFSLRLSVGTITNTEAISHCIVVGGPELPAVLKIPAAPRGTGTISITGDAVLVVQAADEAARRDLVRRLLRLWDAKYRYYGTLTVPGMGGLGTQPESQATRAMREKAGVVGHVIDDALAQPPPILQSSEFSVDDKTLFLAHFNVGTDVDFARGPKRRLTGNAGVTPTGKYGGGLVCRQGVATNSGALSVPYFQLSYVTAGNLSPTEGTVEFWVRPEFTRPTTAGKPLSLYYLFDVPGLLTNDNGNSQRTCIVLTETLGKDVPPLRHVQFFAQGGGGRFENISKRVDWKAGEWHHLAMTWDVAETAFFVDGELAGTRPLQGGLFGGDPARMREAFMIGGNWNSTAENAAEGVLDELRVSSTIRYLKAFTP